MNISNRCRQSAGKLAIYANRILIGLRRAHVRIDAHVDLWVDYGYETRVASRRRIELHSRGWVQASVTLTALACQYALVKPSVACSQYRPAIAGQLGGNAQTWRCHTPRKQCAKTADDVSCFTAVEADCGDVLTERAGMIEPHTGIDCEAISDRYTVRHKQRRCEEFAATVRRSLGDGLKGRPVVIDIPDAGRND